MRLKVIQSFYQENQRKHLIPEAEYFFNQNFNILLETDIMFTIFQKNLIGDCDWFGLISWKYENKIEGENLRQLLSCKPNEINPNISIDFDIIAPSPENYSMDFYPEVITTPHELLNLHTEVRDPMLFLLKRMKDQKIMKHIPEKLFDKMPQIYSNYWIAKKSTYIDYFQNFLKPALEILKKDKNLNSMVCQPSNYPHALSQAFIKATGFDYYPIAPFLFERLINVYIFYKNIKVGYIL